MVEKVLKKRGHSQSCIKKFRKKKYIFSSNLSGLSVLLGAECAALPEEKVAGKNFLLLSLYMTNCECESVYSLTQLSTY